MDDAYSGNLENKMVLDDRWHNRPVLLAGEEPEEEQEDEECR